MGCKYNENYTYLHVNHHSILKTIFFSSGYIVITTILSAVIISINIYFVVNLTITNLTYNLVLIIGVIIYGTIYLLMCAYLILHLAISMLGNSSTLLRNPVSI